MNKILTACLLFYTSIFVQQVYAQADQQALARAQQMLRQINSEKSQLQQQLNALQEEFDEYKKDAERRLGLAQQREDKISRSLDDWQEGYEELKAAHQKKSEQLAYQERRASLLAGNLDKQSQNFELCRQNNRELADISNQLLDLYEGKGFLDLMRENEAFTGIKRVEVQNFVQDKRYQIQDFSLEETSHAVKSVTQPEDDPRMLPNSIAEGKATTID